MSALQRFQKYFAFALIVQFLWDRAHFFAQVRELPPFNPIPWFEVLGIGPPTPVAWQFGFWGLIVALVGVAMDSKPAKWWALALSFWILGIHLSFEKAPDTNYVYHSKNVIIFILLILAIGGPLNLVKWTVAWIYFSSAYVKLKVAGLSWANGETLQSYLLEHALLLEKPHTLWLSNQYELCLALSIGVLFFESSFIIAAFTRRLSMVYALGGLMMHLGALYFMDIQFLKYHALAFIAFFIPASAPRKPPSAC